VYRVFKVLLVLQDLLESKVFQDRQGLQGDQGRQGGQVTLGLLDRLGLQADRVALDHPDCKVFRGLPELLGPLDHLV